MFSKKTKFQIILTLVDLSNVPYVSGLYYIKFKLKNTTHKTNLSSVKDHVVTWNSEYVLVVDIPVARDGVLSPCELSLSVKQQINESKHSEKMGSITLNLSEFANDRKVVKKLLLKESNVNCILRIQLDMKLLKGDPQFLVPRSTYVEEFGEFQKEEFKEENMPNLLENPQKSFDNDVINEIFFNSSQSSTFRSTLSK